VRGFNQHDPHTRQPLLYNQRHAPHD
jgi:hypothetical protein